MSKYSLVIVESPAKAKTIAKYLGSGYQIASSVGHIRDLPKKGMSIDIENHFRPTYVISDSHKKVVTELRKLAKSAQEVVLASDEDREGEAIAWHICHALGLDPKTTKRIVFHEITKAALTEAISKPRHIQQSLVDAQQARRILDRIVGYEMSPVLWKKLRPGLSAGRVQSVAMKLIVEREREIKDFTPKIHFQAQAEFQIDKDLAITAKLRQELVGKDAAYSFLENCKTSNFKVLAIDNKDGYQNPPGPLTTSTLQQAASRKLGFSVRQTMRVAQKLYETGLITYMRTDSMNLSTQAIEAITKLIVDQYGSPYLEKRSYKSRNKNAQEAHEAIRPADFSKTKVSVGQAEDKLYSLIWRQTVASQMATARFKTTKIKIGCTPDIGTFVAQGRTMDFDGWLRVAGTGKDDAILPAVDEGQSLKLISAGAEETFSKPPARFSEASLVRQLEDMGIGRPSTYAPTISTIQDRGYIEKVDVVGQERPTTSLSLKNQNITVETNQQRYGHDKNKLVPTQLAEFVTPFLDKHFGEIMDYGFTSTVETSFDKIAKGELAWTDHMHEFYQRFHPLVEAAEKVPRDEASGMREVGKDPKDGLIIYARMGRFGPMLQKGRAEDSEEKPSFAPLPKDTTIENITLEQALPMFKLPRIVGKTDDGREIKANIGRFGPYVQVDKTFVSLKDVEPQAVSLETAKKLIAEKEESLMKKVIKDFGDNKVLNGLYGPYVTNGSKNAPIPKNKKPEDLTEAEAKEILTNYKPKRRARKQRS